MKYFVLKLTFSGKVGIGRKELRRLSLSLSLSLYASSLVHIQVYFGEIAFDSNIAKHMVTPPYSDASFTKGNMFCDFPFVFLEDEVIANWVNS